MQTPKTLQDIFDDDPFGLLNVKPPVSGVQDEVERLKASFQEIIDFVSEHNREPEPGKSISEHQLLARLKGIREDPAKIELLKPYDRFNLLNITSNKLETFADIFQDDSLGLLEPDTGGLFSFRHISKFDERANADFVARRKPCKDFKKYESAFKSVQQDLSSGKRKFVPFNEENLRAGDYYVHNGILLYLEKVDFIEEIQTYKSGERLRKDGRTRVIFENGTESNMLYRSLYKALLANGKCISENSDKVREDFAKKFSDITDEDTETGLIYVLKSKSEKKEIKEIHNLYKIGFSTVAVEERIKNASQEPTYLMADVRIIMIYKCFNMNPQKFEHLLHSFFGNSCLNVDVFDNDGNRHTPREWFVAPLEIIEQAINLIINGKIVKYRYDSVNERIVIK